MRRRLSILTLLFLLIFTVSCRQQPEKNQKNGGSAESSISEIGDIKKIKITSNQADVRTGCSNDASLLQTSVKDSKFDVVNKVADWYAVKLPDNKIGFVPSNQCKPVVAEDKPAGTTPETGGSAAPPTQGTNQESTTPKTPASKTNTNGPTNQEQEMLRLVNQARSQNNVAPLQMDTELANVARLKSQDMIDNNYFSHNSPKYGDPFAMMKDFGINYVQAGENIAGNQTVQNAHSALMNSPGHRKNILNPNFTHIGIGIKKGGPYGNMFTQMFISKPK